MTSSTQHPDARCPAVTDRRSRRAAALAGGFLLSLPGAVVGQEITDREIFEKSAQAASEAIAHYGTWDDPEEIERINRIGHEIAQQTGFDKFPFTFQVIDMAIPNAFALPAGHIFITRGMLNLGLDDDMLAGLLGHEIAHVTQGHFLKMKKRATLLNVLTQVATIGVMVGASQMDSGQGHYDPVYGYRRSDDAADLVMGVSASGMVLTELLLRSYSRANEDESDDEGQRFAAAAGYDPDGTRRLMEKMSSRLPQEQSFGYWQTHPFFEERVRAARARRSELRIYEPSSADAHRRSTQASLLAYAAQSLAEEEVLHVTEPSPGQSRRQDQIRAVLHMTEQSALDAWPRGEAAEGVRRRQLDRLRESLHEEEEFLRDYGPVLAAHKKELGEVSQLTPESAFLEETLEEIERLEAELDTIHPRVVEVLDGEVQQTPLLATFLSNFPDSERAPAVALQLGLAYTRLGRESEAVEAFLVAWRAGPESDGGQQALRGLSNLLPYLTSLVAVQQLVDQEDDLTLSQEAGRRLTELAPGYEELQNGAEFLERYPEVPWAVAVEQRRNDLADELYKEIILYQRLGDHGKAVAGIHEILTWAPLSPAAGLLTEEAVLEG